ncbi:hypothetical protein AB833_31475 [Chromatiales bacterium (ex Bugula neritina AB1)]|nr:hypothetical protein AB833_31475 [Chromatiales bacterium (ex Bugula neritina AB1)]
MTTGKQTRSVAIIGTGSLACIFAARLADVANVHLIGSWRQQIDAINRYGILLHELDATTSTVEARAICYPEQTVGLAADYVIVLVKSYQTLASIDRIKSCLKADTIVLTLQNGLGNIEQLRDGLPDQFISAGVTMQGGNIKRPGAVIHAGNGLTIIDDSPQLAELIELFIAANLPVETARQSGANSINEVLWRKLIINSAVNPLTALLRQPNGYLVENKAARGLSEATAIETANVARLEGAWPAQELDGAATLTTNAARVTGPNRSSMLQDISRGNRTEIASICGQVVTRAKRHGHKAPYNEKWWSLVQQAESKQIASTGLPLYTIDELV